MLVQGKPYRTVWLQGSSVQMIDQTLLPHAFQIITLPSCRETAQAITDMRIRGAGAIGAAAGYALAQGVLEAPAGAGFWPAVQQARALVEGTRPTARNLFYATERVAAAVQGLAPEQAREQAVQEAQAIADEDAAFCKRIGEHGSSLIRDGARVATHCNAGWLAFVDFGSALSPVYQAVRQGKRVHVYADETRPRGQGASLTSWELQQEGIPHHIIPDNAMGFLMQRKEVDLMLVGADRICAADGSAANKIGTYEKAVCAKDNGIPFYVAAPSTTIDFSLPSGAAIPIEERHEDEVHFVWGRDDQGAFRRVRISPAGTRARNLAFDVTPGRLITGFITERGIHKPDDLMQLRPR
ncbi:MAG: S-methyl-5-thioribose-1-phosphate isomerase [Candidatus Aenigmarchaeota archaeon]|nr:S-methyl-5-thioribose-1-phosphate isomerase [Candidatus Aenigmarchaeota archaeon]